MSMERKQVLEMLAEGKISAADADRLLDKLADAGRQAQGDAGNAQGDVKRSNPTPKFLRVEVDAKDGDRVDIRVPMFLVRTGVKLSTMLPAKVTRRLTENGIDLSQLSGLDGEELVHALRELTVDIHSDGGDRVRVFCE
jgi:hypothetical protein